MADSAPTPSIDPAAFRHVLGHFCSGLTIIAACADGAPVGVTCQSFTSLSIDPPLVGFSPAKSSTSYPQIRDCGRFCINVLADEQEDLCLAFGRKTSDRWAGIDWRPSPSGAPRIAGALAWIDCQLEAEHEVGDHFFVVCRVLGLEAKAGRPLLFFQSRFHRLTA